MSESSLPGAPSRCRSPVTTAVVRGDSLVESFKRSTIVEYPCRKLRSSATDRIPGSGSPARRCPFFERAAAVWARFGVVKHPCSLFRRLTSF